jgi:CHAT domain-containing protein
MKMCKIKILKYSFLLIVFFKLGISSLLSQDLDSSQVSKLLIDRQQHVDNKEFEAGIEVSLRLINYYDQQVPIDYERLIGLSNDVGVLYYYSGNNEKAIEYYEKTLTYIQQEGVPNFERESASLLNIGLIYFSEGAYIKANHYCHSALEKIRKLEISPEREKYEARLLVSLGAIRGEQRKYEEEYVFLQKALNITEGLEGEWQAKLDVYLGLAINGGDKGDSKVEFKYALLAEALMKDNFQSNHNDYPKLYNTLATAYFHRKEYKKAITYYQQAVTYYELYYPPLYTESSIALENIGNCYSKLGDFNKAENYLSKALNVHKSNYGELSPRTAFVHQLLAESYFQKGETTNALLQINKACTSLIYDRNKPFSFNQVLTPYTLLDLFILKNKVLLDEYQVSKKMSTLTQLDSLSSISLALVDSIDISQIDFAEQLALKENYYAVFELGIETQYLLYSKTKNVQYISTAFNLSEKSKNSLLRKAVRNQSVLEKGGISSEWIEKENTLKIEYANLLTEKSYVVLPDSILREIDSELFRVKNELWNGREKVLNEFSSIKSQIEFQFPDISEIQEGLQSNKEAIVQYFLGANGLFVWFISSEKVHFMKVKNVDNLEQQIDIFRNYLFDPNSENCTSLNYSAHQLYLTLFPFFSKNELSQYEKLTIIPSGSIAVIPFELLLASPDSTGCLDANYLINNLNIHYRYSFSGKDTSNKKNSTSSFIGFAPTYNSPIAWEDTLTNKNLAALVRSGNYNLPGAIEEVKQISSLLDGDFLLEEFASEKNFNEQASQFKILHLAMHSMINENEPMLSHLLFSPVNQDSSEDNRLYAIELYNKKLQADLVVLSACNSGFGKIKKGEGVLSLAHAFTYAGVPASIMSLWKVPDEATSQIMIDFYKNLKAGNEKDEALRLAKLSWLNNDAIPAQMKHPYYWAGFIASGDTTPLVFEESSSIIPLGIIAILLSFTAFLIFFQKKIKI